MTTKTRLVNGCTNNTKRKMCRLSEVRYFMRRAMNLKSDLRQFTGGRGTIHETVSKLHDGCYECVDLRVLVMDLFDSLIMLRF